jgi:hypothetical protein
MVWTQSNITNGCFTKILNANGIWVALNNDDSDGARGIYYSKNGMEWVQSNITSGKFSDVYNTNGIWVASSASNSGICYSLTWAPTST